MKRKALAVLAAVLTAAIALGAVLYETTRTRTFTATAVAMGSPVTVRLFARSKRAEALLPGALEEAEKLDKCLSRTIPDSEISLVNSRGEGALGADASHALKVGLTLWRETDGKFDITMGNLSDLWDFDAEDFVPPDDDAVQKARESVGADKMTVEEDRVVLFPGQSLDLGALGKGFACDKICAVLAEEDLTGAIVDAGGTIAVLGAPNGKKPCRVGIRAPGDDPDALLGELACRDGDFISTSGTYEKAAVAGGVRYHHILDPATGCPARTDLAGATVVADSGLLADGLSTCCILLGAEKAQALLSKYGAGGVLVKTDGAVVVTGLERDRVLLYENDNGT